MALMITLPGGPIGIIGPGGPIGNIGPGGPLGRIIIGGFPIGPFMGPPKGQARPLITRTPAPKGGRGNPCC